MIEQETDISVLKAIRTILEKTSLNPTLKEKLTKRALSAEAYIDTGRVFSKEDVIHKM